jgi:hypothetical protein
LRAVAFPTFPEPAPTNKPLPDVIGKRIMRPNDDSRFIGLRLHQ